MIEEVTITLAQEVLNGKRHATDEQRDAILTWLHKIAGPPADIDSRICFGIQFYDSEKKAEAAALISRLQGNTYNGGFYHGMPCGRDDSFDYVVSREDIKRAKSFSPLIVQKIAVGTKLYAVTV